MTKSRNRASGSGGSVTVHRAGGSRDVKVRSRNSSLQTVAGSILKPEPEVKVSPAHCTSGLPDGTDPDNPVRVYADGIFDLFHFGHARALEQAKKLFPHTHLIVGCSSDKMTHAYKGMTVFNEKERYESLRHCRWVDEIVPDAPWVVTQEFLDQHNIHYVAHDALPYSDATGQGTDVYEFVKRMGRFKETKRTDGISTSDIILRIIKNYNEFVLRNLKAVTAAKTLA
eukprot:CAMPEP_0177580460 /NCGR_PEP_ID=MMETSP0419_2-20121207/1571_1 /TAXON_ID=582737 /ORGANISM="Tetraselmis sp., Strain GSL018" /LENGTH=226 /DNA_ID=CAMNT_0019069327 /DNA_START=87 /DNA_END=768 /DNA_ORIENTATION=-